MKTLLRSCFQVSPGENRKLLLDNYFALRSSGLDFDSPVQDGVIWNYVQDFVKQFNHVPDYTQMRVHFDQVHEQEIVDRLKFIEPNPCLTGGDFLSRLNDLAEQRRIRSVKVMLTDAAAILESGMTIREGKKERILKGPFEAVRYVLDKSHELVTPTLGAKLSGEVTRDGADFQAEYRKTSENPGAGIGQYTGIEQIDTALGGAKKSELWIHAGFTGHLKSMAMLNWAYNQAVWFLWDVLIFSLEMPYNQCRRILNSMHSSHRKFAAIRYQLGLQKDPTACVGLPYQHIRDGTLKQWHANAETFLYEYVIPDLSGAKVVGGNDPETGEPWIDSSNYGKIHIEVADPDKTEFSVIDMKARAELIYSQTPFHLLFVDHAGLMSPRKWVSSTTDRLNEVIRDLKRLAMGFNRGMGIPIVGLFQINREGFKQALKRKEKTGTAAYDLTALSYANECERSADVVTATWMDNDLSNANRVQFQCLKARDSKPFEMFRSRVEWPCRRILTCQDVSMSPQQQDDVGKIIDRLPL